VAGSDPEIGESSRRPGARCARGDEPANRDKTGASLPREPRNDHDGRRHVSQEERGARAVEYDADWCPLPGIECDGRRAAGAMKQLPCAVTLIDGGVLDRIWQIRFVRPQVELLQLAVALHARQT
jgi:hypothetical protein